MLRNWEDACLPLLSSCNEQSLIVNVVFSCTRYFPNFFQLHVRLTLVLAFLVGEGGAVGAIGGAGATTLSVLTPPQESRLVSSITSFTTTCSLLLSTDSDGADASPAAVSSADFVNVVDEAEVDEGMVIGALAGSTTPAVSRKLRISVAEIWAC